MMRNFNHYIGCLRLRSISFNLWFESSSILKFPQLSKENLQAYIWKHCKCKKHIVWSVDGTTKLRELVTFRTRTRNRVCNYLL
ncbi:unnamed protein product [Citrullus colocynthis]|uniref:Uncharacterized protein n=1 Tax=Citrullus colocynthis TaxID=252529 RepID=A0ABP0YMU8_9ROSI